MSENYTIFQPIDITPEQILHCSYSYWCPLFKKHTPRSKILKPLSDVFIKYLEQDGIKLAADPQSAYNNNIECTEENEYSDWESDSEPPNKKKVPTDEILEPSRDFADLHSQISKIIQEYGAVCPKLNWSAPRDATWILPNNTMKCTEPNDIYLLLNASNYIIYDLRHAFDECVLQGHQEPKVEYELILREWVNMNPALEFRVFVNNGKIVGVSQRDLNYYAYLEQYSDEFKDLLDEFVEGTVVPVFPDSRFVLDVYIPRPFNKVFLIDINPFARSTDSYLFTWNEILTNLTTPGDYELRLVTEHNTGRFASKEHSENHVPRDIVEASLNPDAIRELSNKWAELLQMQNETQESSDEGDT